MRKEKQLLLDEIKGKIDASKAMLITKYSKLEPNTSWELRELLNKQESEFEVVKKRILLKAAEKSGVQLDEKILEGHIGVVFIGSEDAMKSTKAVIKFSKNAGDLIEVLYGQIEGKLVPGEELVELSKLPSTDEMRTILLGLFISPMSQILAVMETAIAGPLSVIEQKSEQKD